MSERRQTAGGSKFDRIFEEKRTASEPAPESMPEPAADPIPQPDKPPRQLVERTSERRPLGRPPGKRSDPAWKQFSVLLKRDTQREAANILRAKDEGLDLSGLVQNLLESWIKRQKT